MSIETWQEEFMPTPADEPDDIDSALVHVQTKWGGMTKENLEKHGVSVDGKGVLYDAEEDFFFVTADTCALCQICMDGNYDPDCSLCPLDDCDGWDSPYQDWADYHDPAPMIAHIAAAIAARESDK